MIEARRGTLTTFVLVTVCLLQCFALAEPKQEGVRRMLGAIPLMVADNCTQGETQNCTVEGGSGTQTCAGNNTFGACVATSCDDGYVLANGTCESTACTPGDTEACTVADGTGEQTCSNNGTMGPCLATSCDDGYTLQNGACVAIPCTPGDTQNCTVENGSGNQTCSDDGEWEACEATSCDEDYELEDGACTEEDDDVIPYVNLVMLIMLVVLLAVICVAGIVAYVYFAKKERALMKEDMLLA